MTPQEKISELEGEQNRLKEIMSQSDRAALHFIKTSPEFAAAYPEIAAAYMEAFNSEAEKESDIDYEKSDWELHLGEWRDAGDEIPHNDVDYVVIQGHTLSEEWPPESTPALFKKKQSGDWPDWEQPIGPSDAYMKDDPCSHLGRHWRSNIDYNIWEPGVQGSESLWREEP